MTENEQFSFADNDTGDFQFLTDNSFYFFVFSVLFPAFLPINLHTFSEKSLCLQPDEKRKKRSAMTPFYAQNRAERSLKRGSGGVIFALLVPLFLCFSLLFGSLQGCVNSIHASDLGVPALPDDLDFTIYHNGFCYPQKTEKRYR